jgi:hypothetical protein
MLVCMRLPVRGFASMAALCVAAACSQASSSGGPAAPASAGDAAAFTPLPASPTTFDMSFTVAAGAEDFECTYVTMPATAGFIVAGQHEYTKGSHHLLIYRTTLTSVPAGEGTPTLGDCYAPDATYMNSINGVVYPAATPTGSLTMPDGVGLPYAANAVYLFQVHYLNATADPLDAHVSVHLTTSPGPVKQNAGVLFFYDPFIDVPMGAGAVASMRCPIPQDITLFTESSHYHARGVGYQAYLDPPTGAEATTPFYTSNNWASPTIALDSIPIQAGSHLRYYCDYDNTAGTQAYFQGQSAQTNEMCMFIGMYYPAMTTAQEECFNGDTYGTGMASCTNTLSCLSACPADDAGAAGSGPQEVAFSPCIQQCFADSCPDASAPLVAALQCIQSQCGSACGSSGTACDSCVAANCASQYEACANAACGTVPAP